MANYLDGASPTYELISLEPDVQWWWHEGHIWGRLQEIAKQEALHLAYQQEITRRDETIRAQEVMIRGLRNDFTYRAARRNYA